MISPNLGESYNALLNKLISTPQTPFQKWGLTQSFLWLVGQKPTFEKCLRRLGRFNDYLHEILDAQQQRALQDQQRRGYMDLIQMKSSVDDIRNLTQAAHASRAVHFQSNAWQRTNDTDLENLAAFKSLYLSMLEQKNNSPAQIEISSSRLQLQIQNSVHNDYPRATCEVDGQVKKVWINWQDTFSKNDNNAIIEELTILLMAPKPDEICIPPCIGYSILPQQNAKPRHALIFENPTGVAPNTEPESLAHAIEYRAKPSLTDRIVLASKLAQCLLYIHSVNWLHKAFRSSNILFFPEHNLDFKVTCPYITGFDNSRRSIFNENTSEVPRAGRLEVYRHPDTQLTGPNLTYRKTFDIYSLGIVLIEIALWQSIISVMGMETSVDHSPRIVADIQSRWLTSDQDLLRKVRADAGDNYAGVVETCLKGRDAFGIDRRDVETNVTTGLSIQRQFNTKVISVLAGLII